MLVRWWNGDCDGTGKGGDSNWLDASKAKTLVASSSDKGPQQPRYDRLMLSTVPDKGLGLVKIANGRCA